MRYCFDCGTATTKYDNRRIGKLSIENWYRDGNNFRCHRCRVRIIDDPKTNNKWHKRRITFKNKRPLLKENPRKGICKKCGRTNCKTEIHHIQYHEDDPLRDTIELCSSCHAKESNRLEQIGFKKGNYFGK